MLWLFQFRAKMCVYWQSRHGKSPFAPVEVSSVEKSSRVATPNIFTRTLSGGIKPEESVMWTHERLDGLLDAEDEEDVELISSD